MVCLLQKSISFLFYISSIEDLWTNISNESMHEDQFIFSVRFGSVLLRCIVLCCVMFCSFRCWPLFWDRRWNCIEYRFLLSSCVIEYFSLCSCYLFLFPHSNAYTLNQFPFKAICTVVYLKKSFEIALSLHHHLCRGLVTDKFLETQTRILGLETITWKQERNDNKNEKMHELWSHTGTNLVAGINCIENFEMGQWF